MAADDTTKFVDAIGKLPTFRRSLSADPVGTLKAISSNIGVKPENVSLAAVELMAGLNETEVQMIKDLRARIPQEIAAGHDGAIIF